jgi:hypothetical protein
MTNVSIFLYYRPRGEDMLEYFRLLDYGIVAPSGMQILAQVSITSFFFCSTSSRRVYT